MISIYFICILLTSGASERWKTLAFAVSVAATDSPRGDLRFRFGWKITKSPLLLIYRLSKAAVGIRPTTAKPLKPIAVTYTSTSR